MENPLYTTPKVLMELAHLFGTEVNNGRVEVPQKWGSGYCAGCIFNEHVRILILNYVLKEEITIPNPEAHMPGKILLFKFQDNPSSNIIRQYPSVLIATSRINTDEVISVQHNTPSVNIEIDADYLAEMFPVSHKSQTLKSLVENTQPLLFEQMAFPVLQTIFNEIVSESMAENFKWIYRKIKAEELICRLLIKLEERQENRLYPLNKQDIQAVFNIREGILSHLETPPVLKDLAIKANMSPTKLKTLFKQVFGNSIFSYYQTFRMKEAARLLREERLSVSETGYNLGFSNLSHFTRVFELHIGMKPKRYSTLDIAEK